MSSEEVKKGPRMARKRVEVESRTEGEICISRGRNNRCHLTCLLLYGRSVKREREKERWRSALKSSGGRIGQSWTRRRAACETRIAGIAGFQTGEEEREGKVSARFDGLILRRHRFDYLSTSILRVTLAYVCYIGKNCLPSYDRF